MESPILDAEIDQPRFIRISSFGLKGRNEWGYELHFPDRRRAKDTDKIKVGRGRQKKGRKEEKWIYFSWDSRIYARMLDGHYLLESILGKESLREIFVWGVEDLSNVEKANQRLLEELDGSLKFYREHYDLNVHDNREHPARWYLLGKTDSPSL